VTWDEDDGQHGNQIATLFHGPMVKRGVYSNRITHYDVLRTVEALFGLPYAGEAASATTITNVW
jgi:predicted AlkP superfamily phosphohydrolase/phosphomutase